MENAGKRPRSASNDAQERAPKQARHQFVDTEPLLKQEILRVRKSRREKRSQMTINQKVESSRKHFLNDQLDPGITPGTAESKLHYGVRMPPTPVLTREQHEHRNPDVLYDMPDLSRAEADDLANLERESLGLDRIASHFVGPSYFKESSGNASASVSINSGAKSKRALQADGTASAPGDTDSTLLRDAHQDLAKACGLETDHQMRVRKAVERSAAENKEKRRRNREARRKKQQQQQQQGSGQDATTATAPAAKSAALEVPEKYRNDPALFDGNPSSNDEFAIMNWRGLYQMSRHDIESFKDLTRKDIKIRCPPRDFMIPTDAPPSGNDNVIAARRSLLKRRGAMEREASDALDPAKQGEPSPGAMPSETGGGVPLGQVGGPEPAALFAVERREVRVVDSRVYDDPDDDLQDSFKMKGDVYAARMAESHRRRAAVDAMDVDDPAERMLEQGHDPTQPTVETMFAEDEVRGLPTHSIDEESTVQPMVRYLNRYREKATHIAALGMVEQLVFDQSGHLGNLTPKVGRWATTSDGSAKIDLKTQSKILSADARRAARNVKKQREVVGLEACFAPPRRRTRFCHNKTRYCLDMLRQNDIFFANDRVKFAKGRAMQHAVDGADADDAAARKANLVVPDRSEPTASLEKTQDLLESSRGGLIGSLCDRILRETATPPQDRVGSDYFVSSYELGTDRLHPSVNPEIVVVSMQYHLRYMEQARPDLRAYERECARGEDCWCYSRGAKTADHGTYFEAKNSMSFVCKEFLLPAEETRARTLNELPEKRKLCILCQLEETTRRVASLQYSGTLPSRPINDHRVRVGERGEYNKENCLPVTYNRSNKRICTGIVGHFPQFNEIFFRHAVRAEDDLEIRYISYSPSTAGFC